MMVSMFAKWFRFLALPVCSAVAIVGALGVAVHDRLGTAGSPLAPWQYPMTSSGAVTIWVGMDKSVMRDGFREVGVASSRPLGGALEVYAVEATPGWKIGRSNWLGCQKFSRMKLVGPGRYEGAVGGLLVVEGAAAGAKMAGGHEVGLPSSSNNNIALLGTCVT
jgi:hypothetical protein